MVKGLLDCIIGPGQFSNEVSVLGTMYGETEFSLFVPLEYIINGKLMVKILNENEDHYLIKLPRDAFEIGSTIIVNKNLVSL